MTTPITDITECSGMHTGLGDYIFELATAVKTTRAAGVKFQVFPAEEVVASDDSESCTLKIIGFGHDQCKVDITVCATIELDGRDYHRSHLASSADVNASTADGRDTVAQASGSGSLVPTPVPIGRTSPRGRS
jgi:hypothetical protein